VSQRFEVGHRIVMDQQYGPIPKGAVGTIVDYPRTIPAKPGDALWGVDFGDIRKRVPRDRFKRHK
jgi:hypothetical protein